MLTIVGLTPSASATHGYSAGLSVLSTSAAGKVQKFTWMNESISPKRENTLQEYQHVLENQEESEMEDETR